MTTSYLVLSIVVAVCGKEDTQSGEVVLATKHRAILPLLLRVPEGKAVAKQVLPLTMNLELYHHLPVVHTNRLWANRWTDESLLKASETRDIEISQLLLWT